MTITNEKLILKSKSRFSVYPNDRPGRESKFPNGPSIFIIEYSSFIRLNTLCTVASVCQRSVGNSLCVSVSDLWLNSRARPKLLPCEEVVAISWDLPTLVHVCHDSQNVLDIIN